MIVPVPALGPVDLGAMVKYCLTALNMSDWRFTVEWCDAANMPIKGAIATCEPHPARKLVHVKVLRPWPAGESLSETLYHELVHAKLSPLTSLIEHSDASVMIEEAIVEDLGVILASKNQVAARAVSTALGRLPALRARIAASASKRRGRIGKMALTAEQASAALDALKSGDGAAALEFLSAFVAEQLASAAGGGEAAGPASDRGAGYAQEGAQDGKDAPMPREADEGKDAPAAARKARVATVDAETLRARRQTDALAGSAIRARIREVRADGLDIDAAAEKELLETRDIDAADKMISWMRRGAAKASGGQTRARSGVQLDTATAPKVPGAPPVTAETLKAEGFQDPFIAHYQSEHARDPEAAKALLDGGRMMARKSANPWAAQKGGN